MTEAPIQFAVQERIATLTLNRPAKLNAVTMPMLDDIEAALKTLDADPECRVLIIAAAGDKAFSAGADIHAWAPLGPLGMWREWIRRGHQVFDRLAELRQPTIAVVQGMALGGGLELALACDLRLAADTASFALPEATIGAIPGWGGTQRLPRLIGPARAKQMIFTGTRIDAGAALHWGLINEVLPAAGLMARAQTLARQIAGNAPIAVQTAKQLINSANPPSQDAALEALASAVNAASADGQEGLTAFREKRKPDFSGR